ncbi:MAG: hypothetical protein RLZZ414_1070 [Bacteroidota bacterium]|jgi:hypothetical protein
MIYTVGRECDNCGHEETQDLSIELKSFTLNEIKQLSENSEFKESILIAETLEDVWYFEQFKRILKSGKLNPHKFKYAIEQHFGTDLKD